MLRVVKISRVQGCKGAGRLIFLMGFKKYLCKKKAEMGAKCRDRWLKMHAASRLRSKGSSTSPKRIIRH
jgi:hypothetical protein